MVRRFLYVVAALVVLFFAGRVALTFYGGELATWALVPGKGFEAQAPLAGDAYDRADMWLARPGMADDPALFRPEGLAAGEAQGGAEVFFVHPTSFMDRSNWNGPLVDPQGDRLATAMVRGMASAFNASGEIWAPRYRQATMGAFLADRPEREPALNLAYGDVRAAFRAFVRAIPADRPIVLAGHSQGALHLKRLIRDEVAGTPLARRIVAAYVIGWPVSLAHDLPAMGLPACAKAGQPGCVASWLSYAEPADPRQTLAAYGRFAALDGQSPRGSTFLCTNPLSWTVGGAAPASANPGTLVPDAAMTGGKLVRAMVPARCGPQGLLLIGPGPELGQYVLPGNNYHVYDIPLFWASLRADVAGRLAAWKAGSGKAQQ